MKGGKYKPNATYCFYDFFVKKIVLLKEESIPKRCRSGSFSGNSFCELILIGCPRFSDIVRADGVDSTLAQDLGNPRAYVSVKVEFHSAAAQLILDMAPY
jgi:hypothetical protein